MTFLARFAPLIGWRFTYHGSSARTSLKRGFMFHHVQFGDREIALAVDVAKALGDDGRTWVGTSVTSLRWSGFSRDWIQNRAANGRRLIELDRVAHGQR